MGVGRQGLVSSSSCHSFRASAGRASTAANRAAVRNQWPRGDAPRDLSNNSNARGMFSVLQESKVSAANSCNCPSSGRSRIAASTVANASAVRFHRR